jgi:hypothetical protein
MNVRTKVHEVDREAGILTYRQIVRGGYPGVYYALPENGPAKGRFFGIGRFVESGCNIFRKKICGINAKPFN